MPFKPHPKGITAAIRLTPGARVSGLTGLMKDAEGRTMLKISVSAPPEDGKANKALIAFLAKEWSIPKTDLSILSGETHRQKTLLVTGNTDTLLTRVNAWLERLADNP